MIPLFKVAMSDRVDNDLLKVLHSGYIGQGEQVEKFEKALMPIVGNRKILTVSAGTHAIHLALELIGVEEGDEVITSPLTCTATNWPILMCGADPIWCDIDPNTGNISPKEIEKKITNKTKAIMVVHWGGYPCDMDKISEISTRHRIPVIEDAAHAFGAEYKGWPIGSISDFTAFSFQAIKHLTTVDGGLLSTLHYGDYKRGKLLRWYGIDRETPRQTMRCEGDISEWGYKYHMNDIAATIGLGNLKDLGYILKTHRENAVYYREELQDIDGLELLIEEKNVKSSYWIFTIKVDRRDDFVKMMNDKGIMVNRVHERNDIHSCVRDYYDHRPKNLNTFVEKMICIPVGWWVSQIDREYIVGCIKEGW